MMLEIAVGDAYGAGFEGCDAKFVAPNNDLYYVNHPRKLRKNPESYQPSLVKAGCYTDDTQMAIAVAEAMLDENEPWTKTSLADRFVRVFHRDERRGYTPYFLHVLLNSNNGRELLSKIDGKSTKSGGAMRAGPCGLYPDFEDVVRHARAQAAITHNSWLGQNSAVGAALMVHYFYYDLGPKDELCGWLRDNYFADTLHSPHPFEADGEHVHCWAPGRRVRVHAWDVLEAAIYAIEEHDSLSEILAQCVAYTGDVDTVAAIAMGPASLSREVEQDLPEHLIEGLENRKYGRDFLRDLDSKLFAAFPRPEVARGVVEADVPASDDRLDHSPDLVSGLVDLEWPEEVDGDGVGLEDLQGDVQAESSRSDDGLATAGPEGSVLGVDLGPGPAERCPLEDGGHLGGAEEDRERCCEGGGVQGDRDLGPRCAGGAHDSLQGVQGSPDGVLPEAGTGSGEDVLCGETTCESGDAA